MSVNGVITCASAIVLWLASAHADPNPAKDNGVTPMAEHTTASLTSTQVDTTRPWAAGVSEAEQGLALRLYGEGNTAFLESRFAEALARYRDAIRHWDHPAIRFNMAVCLINLDQPIEAMDNLELGLAHGPAPLGDEIYREGLTYRKLLKTRITKLEITCKEPAAEVRLDGELVIIAPGALTRYILPGDHQIVATKPGFLTTSKTLAVTQGQDVSFHVELVAYKPAPRTIRRWRRWEPLATLTAGGVVTGLGVFAYVAAARNFAEYDDRVRKSCPCDLVDPLGLRAAVGDVKETAEAQRLVAYSSLAVGGVILATGALMMYLNRPRIQSAPRHPIPALMPAHGGAAAAVRWTF